MCPAITLFSMLLKDKRLFHGAVPACDRVAKSSVLRWTACAGDVRKSHMALQVWEKERLYMRMYCRYGERCFQVNQEIVALSSSVDQSAVVPR